MKCPNCGAEIKNNSKFCEFCGSAISTEMRREQEQLNKAGCPKCGSTNISFSREKQGEIRGKGGTAVVRSTVGMCKDCGYTWQTDSGIKKPKKRKTWLWVLGWIFIFPVPLTILMLRKKDMKPVVKYGIIAVAWLLYIGIGLSNNEETDTTKNDIPSPNASVQVEQLTTSETEAISTSTENTSTWAEQEKTIRRFVSEFNEISDTPISEIQFKNNHTIAYLSADGFADLSIEVNDHKEMGFIFTFEFNEGTSLLGKYEALMRDIVKVFDANVDVGEKFQEANQKHDAFIPLSDSISVEYHYIKDAIGYKAGDTYIITLVSTDYNK